MWSLLALTLWETTPFAFGRDLILQKERTESAFPSRLLERREIRQYGCAAAASSSSSSQKEAVKRIKRQARQGEGEESLDPESASTIPSTLLGDYTAYREPNTSDKLITVQRGPVEVSCQTPGWATSRSAVPEHSFDTRKVN